MPPGLLPAERLAFAEAALTSARNVSATFEVEAQGSTKASLTGTLQLVGENALSLVAEGSFAGEPVRVELDSRSGDINRSTTKGADVSGHRDPPAAALTQAVCLGLTRMGVLHNVARLVMDQGVDRAQGGVEAWVKAVDVKEGGPDTASGESCHRVDFAIEVAGQRAGEASLCLSDATALPLHRRQTVHFEAGDMTVVENFHWTVK
ncbi:MAG: hypothetical protein AB1938_19080 [Myxococcota bacterium]